MKEPTEDGWQVMYENEDSDEGMFQDSIEEYIYDSIEGLPKDEHGFTQGRFKVIFMWKPPQKEE